MAEILIVDDSEFMRTVLSDILRKGGYEDLVQVSNGEEAIEVYEREKPDLVMLDLILPKKDGLDVLAAIVPKGAKVIMTSIISVEKIIEETKNRGAKEYTIKSQDHAVKKPYDPVQVLEIVKKALGE